MKHPVSKSASPRSVPATLPGEIAVDFIPGRLILMPGSIGDYIDLAPFHYVAARPATFAKILAIHYLPPVDSFARPSPRHRTAAVAVLSYPSLVHQARHRVFGLSSLSMKDKLTWSNSHLRTISRVIVHPQFRSIGLAIELITALCEQCPTPFIEASARMGRAHPMFERAGFTRVDPTLSTQPIYYHRPAAATAQTAMTS